MPCHLLRFADVHGNSIEMYPAEGKVIAELRHGENLILGLPVNYKKYILHIPNSLNITAAEVDYIYRWKNIAELSISEGERVPDLAYRMTLRPSKMKAMTQLWSLRFSLHQGIYEKFSVAKFLKHLPAIELISVDVKELKAGQIDRFIENQSSLKNWMTKVKNGSVAFERK